MNLEKTLLSRRRGLTLIELLAVIAVIGILAALITVAARNALNRAARTGSASNLRQAGALNALYALDNKNVICPSDSGKWGNSEFWPEYGDYQPFVEFLGRQYGSGYKVWERPRDDFKDPQRASVTRTRGPISWSYARNLGLPQKASYVNGQFSNNRVDNTVSMNLLPYPSKTMMFMETNSSLRLYFNNHDQVYFDSNDRTYICYVDGHVAPLTKQYMIGDDPDTPASWVADRRILWFGFPDSKSVKKL